MKFIFPQNYNFKNKLFGFLDYSTIFLNLIWFLFIFLFINLFFNNINIKIFLDIDIVSLDALNILLAFLNCYISLLLLFSLHI